MLDQTPGGLQFTRGKLTHIAGLPSLMFRPPGKAATLDESPPFEVQPVDIESSPHHFPAMRLAEIGEIICINDFPLKFSGLHDTAFHQPRDIHR